MQITMVNNIGGYVIWWLKKRKTILSNEIYSYKLLNWIVGYAVVGLFILFAMLVLYIVED